MSHQFRELLKKVGSGQHTKKDLTRSEAAIAGRMMLTQEATPAQIGAFLIAHRIKRPTGMELAGFLDAYDELGGKIAPLPDSPRLPLVFGVPYDGRTRTAPIVPLTALLLATAGIPVILHGGDSLPTKYGLPLIDIFQALGLDFCPLSLTQVHQLLVESSFTFYYMPKHFPLAQGLVTYRDEIGKRPPLATLELIWSPYGGESHLVAGYVHPPTEQMIRVALQERGEQRYTLVKGLEGSCDLRLSQTTIIAIHQANTESESAYLKLDPHPYGLAHKEIPLEQTADYFQSLEQVLEGQLTNLAKAVIWNSAFYLWHYGVCENLKSAIAQAEFLLTSGQVNQKRQAIHSQLAQFKKFP
ncbi:MAG: anthranilate phosphoribosyltransferase family protein [Snowella sp.]|nr:anthranilate phosphoribosyltransferase family protein [Snowella sp.]